MLSTFSQTEREALIAPLQTDQKHWEKAIKLLSAPWSVTFSRNCINVLKDYSQQVPDGHDSFWTQVLSTAVLALHPSCFELAQELQTVAPESSSSWKMQQIYSNITTFTTRIQLRARILEEI
jgi:hypothetical protein